jgi:Ca-activated chloride channel family protein
MMIDDPRLTAYALDELSPSEREEIEKLLTDSPEAQQFVNETCDFASVLQSEYRCEGVSETAKPLNLIDIRDDPWFWSVGRPLAIAALLALLGLIAALLIGRYNAGPTVADRGPFVNLPTAVGPVHLPPPSSAAPAAGNPSEVQGELTLQPPSPAGSPLMAEADRVIVLGSNIPSAEEVGPNPVVGPAPERSGKTKHGKARGRNGEKSSAAGPQRLAEFGNRVLDNSSNGYPATLGAKADKLFDGNWGYDAGFRQTNDIRSPSGSFNTAAYEHILENPFLDAVTNPLSTFSIDVDTASYSNIRRFINHGELPPRDAVRIEEMINYFTYDYPQPQNGKPFSINLDVASCPWEASHRLVRIGLKGREIATDKRGPSNLVFLLDVSGSMTPPERLPLVKEAMQLWVEQLTPNDRVAIVVYAGASGMVLPSTTGDHKDQIHAAIESLQPGGSTNGAEGIQLAYKIAAQNFIKGGVNRVILATDGDFNVGVTSESDLVRLIQEKAKTGVFLSVLGVGDDNLKDSTMQKLADKGNGNYAYLDSLDEARKVLVKQMNGTLVTIAKDVKIQVEFNPARVASYRLIGYEKRMLSKEDFNNDKVDAGEIGAGHTVTALYEVVPVGVNPNPAASVPPVDRLKYSNANQSAPTGSAEMLTVKLRHKQPDGDKSEVIEQAITDNGIQFDNAPADFRFASAVAEFGLLLRNSEYKGNGSLEAVLEWAEGAKGNDPEGYRAGFIELVKKAQSLRKG